MSMIVIFSAILCIYLVEFQLLSLFCNFVQYRADGDYYEKILPDWKGTVPTSAHTIKSIHGCTEMDLKPNHTDRN